MTSGPSPAEIPHGEGVTPVRRATDEHHLEVLNLADPHAGDLSEARRIPSASDLPWLHGNYKFSGHLSSLGLAGTIANTEAEAREPARVEVRGSEGVPLAANAAPAPVKGTTSVGLIDAAEGAATAEPEALEAWSGDKAGRGICVAP